MTEALRRHMLAWRWFEFCAALRRSRREARWFAWDRALGDAAGTTRELSRRDWS